MLLVDESNATTLGGNHGRLTYEGVVVDLVHTDLAV